MKGISGSVNNSIYHNIFLTSINNNQKEVEAKDLVEKKKNKK